MIAEDVNTSTEFAGASARAMLDAGAVAVQSTPVFDRTGSFMGMLSTHYRQPHRFEAHELRWLDLLALHVSEVLERKRTHTQLAQSQAELEQRVADRTQWLILMHEVSRAINEAPTWDDALRRVLQRICEMEHWQICYVYLPDPKFPESLALAITSAIDDRFRHFHALAQQQRYDKGQSLPGRVYTRAEPIWLNDPQALASAMPIRGVAALKAGLHAAAVLPVTLNDQVIAVLELLSDQPHPPNEQLSVLMRDVSDQIARVLERERVTAHMADLLWREQQDLLHTLHDALGQTLTGLGMLSGGLSERLAGTDVSNAESAREIARQAKNALEQVRQLTKSLFPVEVEAESLTAALRDLAAATQSLHHIQVRVDGQGPKHLRDGSVATQLYRIAQEAITNAVKHARAHAITIRLDGDAALLRLQVSDDGVGIRPAQKHDGMGLKIMRYRASSIGGVLSVEPGAASGTVVSCVLPTDSGAHA